MGRRWVPIVVAVMLPLSITSALAHGPDEAQPPGKPAWGLICGPGLHFDEPSGRCRRDVPLDPNSRPQYKDTVTAVDGREITREEASEIIDRHLDELLKIPGQNGAIYVDRQGRGIAVEVDNPIDINIPKEVGGLPVIPVPWEGPYIQSSHTINIHPPFTYGAVAVTDRPFVLGGSFTVPVLSKGRLWGENLGSGLSFCIKNYFPLTSSRANPQYKSGARKG